MKQRTWKKAFSALCLALALCIAAYPAALAQETVEDTGSIAAAAETAEAESSAADEESDDAEAAAADSTGSDPADEADTAAAADSSDSDGALTSSADGSDSAADDETSGEEQASSAEDAAQEETAIVTAQAATVSIGWSQDDNGDWTFYYKATSSATALTQAQDVVLCIPDDCTAASATFAAGYYYFNANGLLVADGTTASVGSAVILNSSFVCDSTASDAGKLYQVTTTQTTNSGQTTFSSTASLYTGQYSSDGLWYYNGEIFTGYVRRYASDVVWHVKNGVGGTRLTGCMDSSTPYVRMDTGAKSVSDGLWYYNGSVFTGYVRRYASDVVWYVKSGVGGTRLTGQMSSGTAYVRMDTGAKGKGDGLWYYSGSVFTGYVRRYASDVVWYVKNGVGGTRLTGLMSTGTAYVRMDTGAKGKGDGKYYKNGVVYTGVANCYYYSKGVKQTYKNCWKTFDSNGNASSKSSANTYYFNSSGKAVTGWNTLSRNGSSYRFYFNSDGTLCKNLYKVSSAWKQKATKLVISRSTHTATLYAKYGSSYSIPTKSFVVSTSRSASNFKVGTYKLTSRKSWFTIDSTNWWYKWGTYISGSGSWCHSEQYYTKGDSNSLRISSYNALGTNQSKQCIRMQVVNAKLIYDMKGYGSIKTVVLNKSSSSGPFGKMTITDNVDKSGKLSGTKGYDPTDPLYT